MARDLKMLIKINNDNKWAKNIYPDPEKDLTRTKRQPRIILSSCLKQFA